MAFEELSLDLQSGVAERNDQQFHLNQIQFIILKTLMANAPNFTSREALINTIWGDEQPEADLLRSHIYQLRQIIDKPFKEQYLRTIPKKGYQLVKGKTE